MENIPPSYTWKKHRSRSIRSDWFHVRCFLVSLTSYIDVEFQFLVAATVQHSATKGHILVLTRRVDGQVARGCVEPVWSWFTLNLVGGSLDFNPSSGPGENDGRRVEAIGSARQMALCFQHQPQPRHVQRGGDWIGGRRGGGRVIKWDKLMAGSCIHIRTCTKRSERTQNAKRNVAGVPHCGVVADCALVQSLQVEAGP